MLTVIGKILVILGFILLILLGILLIGILLILFFPITYRIRGERDTEHTLAALRVNWLFGLLRLRFIYPEPGNVIVKILWITLYDSSAEKKSDAAAAKAASTKESINKSSDESANAETKDVEEPPAEPDTIEQQIPDTDRTASDSSSSSPEETTEPKQESRIQKIRYTIQSICDKIKHISALLKDEETKALFLHARSRIGKILWSMRPRRLRTVIIYGTGEPDITGYLYGIYGILSPKLGKHVQITPDFTQLILEGTFYAAGHIMVIHLLINALSLLLDKKLRRFINKIKQLKKNL